MKQDTFCILAEQGLHLHNSGRCNSCSDSLEYWKDANGQDMTLDQISLEDIWNSDDRKNFVKQLNSGVQHSNCEKCWQKERVGIPSKRQTANKDWLDSAKLEKTTPQYIDLKWGNVCNLKCRHCNPWTSSRWIKDWHNLDSQFKDIEYKEYLEQFVSTNKSYNQSNHKNFHDKFKQWFAECEHLSLYGGEGMYVPAVLDTLDHAVQTGDSKNIDLYINTNGSIYSEQWIETLKQFRKVRMAFSLDGINKSFEYIRYGAEWENVKQNFLAYKQAGFKVEIVTTIFVHNVFDSMDIIKNLYLEFDRVADVNWVYGPEWLDVRILPNYVKQKCLDKIKTDWNNMQDILQPHNVDQFTQQYHELVNFIPDTVKNREAKLEQLKRWTRALDKSRNQNFAEVFPDYNNIIKIYE